MAGKDFSTIHGLSKKADESIRQSHGGAYSRAIPTGGRRYEPDGKAGVIRSLLREGPMTRLDIARATGFPYKSISGMVKNDVAKGRIREIRKDDERILFELVEAQ